MGKSNLVRFIVSHPEARTRYLKERADEFTFVHVDCASFRRGDEGEILDELAAQLQRTGLASRPASQVEGPQDSRHRLKELLLGIEPNLNVVVVLDYFDRAGTRLDQSFYDFLSHLRNARPRGKLSYVLVSRRSIGNLYELQQLLDDDCVVTPLVHKDAMESLRRDEVRLGVVFNVAQRDRLIACTGGHPGFLKNAAELVADGPEDASETPARMAGRLLGSQKIQRLCRELWEEFTPAEQEVLSRVARDFRLGDSVENEVRDLKKNGILTQRDDGKTSSGASVFCPLFELYVRDQMAPSPPARIAAVLPNQARIETPAGVEDVRLSPKLFALLRALEECRVRRNDERTACTNEELPDCTNEKLKACIYGTEAEAVNNEALAQLVERLRKRLNRRVQELTGDPTYNCVLNERGAGYRLNG